MYNSSWFSLTTRRVIDDDTLILPSALSRSMNPRTMTTHLPSTSSSNRRRSRSPALSRLRRRGVLIALVIALPILALLIMDERHSQRVALASWAAELTARENAAYPDPRGRVDLAAWRNRMAGRQNLEQELELERRAVSDEDEEWPAWWGNADEVGPSPFDHVPSPLDGKRRILFLTAYDDYLQRMNTHTYEIVDAALRHPNVIVDVWGPGWAGYDWNVPLSVNVKRRANRIAQLETSRAEHTAAAIRTRQAAARERWASERNNWFRMFAQAPPPVTDMPNEESDFEPWTTPEWIERVDECNDAVRYDIVWTISLERKLIRKYAQALLSGCVIASDLPTEHEEAMMGLVIRLEPTWDIDRIQAEINKYLAQPEVLHQMALDGFAYARKHLTTTAKISDMLRLVEAHRSGARGYDHAHSFSSRCRSYSGHVPPPPWCNKQEGHRGLEDRLDPL
ncbi:hypothetical protein CspHIS471_0313420 [Cutaneotrichosporon sp. HIS471]|nr:hypothetical protein CspHIS471_0313420 [Cutaneotrichosporon sp. HIS471]